MLTYVLGLVVVSYGMFVFISDFFNPFIPSRAPLRKRGWRLGRAAALSSLTAGSVALVLFALSTFDSRAAIGLYLVLTTVFVIPSIVKHKKSAIWQ